MNRELTLCALALSSIAASAQFGPIQFAFTSDVSYPSKVISGDVDGDGDIDPIVYGTLTGGSTSWISWFPNLGGGAFGPKQPMLQILLGSGNVLRMRDMDHDGDGDLLIDANWYSNDGIGNMTLIGAYSPVGGAALLLEDLDGDGDVDDVVRSATGVNLLLNNGSGTFTVGTAIGTTGTNSSLYASRADLNGDAVPDLMIGGNNTQVGWYQNLGGGNYGPQQTIPDFVSPGNPFCGDVDGDGDNDVIGFGLLGGTIWFANDGVGGFTLGDTIPAGLPTAIADWDGDGDVDFSVGTGTTCNVHILRNNAGLSWAEYAVENFSGYNLVGTGYGTGDLDGNGSPDLLVCSGLDVAAWYPNLGGGVFGPRARFCQTMTGGYDVSASDIDFDGDLDLVTASYYGDFIAWYANNGDGTFGRQQPVVENRDAISVSRTADLDGDDYPEILTNASNSAVIWNNGGGASWTPDTLQGLGTSRCEVDIDGDLDIDLIGSGQWYENDGTGEFTVHTEPLLTGGQVKSGDLEGDGDMDLVIGSTGGITALINDGAQNFTVVASSGNVYRFGIADLDDDGDLDLAAMPNTISIRGYYNDGSGHFTEQTLYAGGAGFTRTILVDDLNGDGFADVAWALSNGYTHQTYYNLNLGDGTLGPANLIDPTAESAAQMILADLNNDVVLDLVTVRFRTISWQENEFYNAFRLRGCVFKDFDLDAQLDMDDIKVPFQLVKTDANDILVWTNSAGDYDLPADTGTWDVWTNHPSIYQITNDPDTLTATLTVPEPIEEGLDFGMSPAVQDTAGFLTMTTSGTLRCNTDVDVWVHLQNTGTFIPEDVLIDLYVHPDLTVNFSSEAPDSVAGDHYYWHVDSLGWFQQWGVWLSVTTGPVGSMSLLTATVTYFDPQFIFTAYVGGPVSCAFDPNDKLVTPEGYGAFGAVPVDQDWLTYTVRFQNTGTDTAFTVVLRDTLDADLDWASMQIVAASHALTQIQVDSDGVATFGFRRILLPDSVVDEPASHGFVKYRIRPQAGSPDGTTITNSAAIFFDLNAPVLTNTVLNTLVDCDLFTPTVSISGADELQGSAGDAYQWFLNGDSLAGADQQNVLIFGPGDYTVQVTSIYGCVAVSDPFNVISTGVMDASTTPLTVSPNPTNGDIHLWANVVLGADLRIELLDACGHVVRAQQGSGRQDAVIERGELPAGMYLVRVTRAGATVFATRAVLR